MTVSIPDPSAGPTGWSLTPGTRLLWRGDGSFELERAHDAVVVAGLDRGLAMHLARRRPATPAFTRRPPVPLAVTSDASDVEALERLTELGYVRAHRPGRTVGPAPGTGPQRWSADLPPVPHPGEAPGPGPDPLLPARRELRVVVHGITRVSAYLGALLAASGVGHVSFASTGTVRRRDLLPGGLGPKDEGRRFAAAATDAVLRAAPDVDVTTLAAGEPDLVVVCTDAPVEPDLRDLLHHRRRAHLPVHVDSMRGEVGPLVVPGVSACLRCGDLHRLDQDPAWSLLAVQLLTGAATAAASEPGLAARVGALAAACALGYLDASAPADPSGGSWELRTGWPAPRRRARVAHPDCDCRAAWGVRAGAHPTW